jgi:hypothetical protein
MDLARPSGHHDHGPVYTERSVCRTGSKAPGALMPPIVRAGLIGTAALGTFGSPSSIDAAVHLPP